MTKVVDTSARAAASPLQATSRHQRNSSRPGSRPTPTGASDVERRRRSSCLQHFTGTLDNWDPAVTDALAEGREVILFESAGLGRSTGEVPDTIQGMTAHFLAFADALGLTQVDLLGFSLGGMVAQQAALERPSLVRRMLLVGTAPEGGEDIMHLEKPELSRILQDPNLQGYQVLVKLFFTPSESSQAAGQAFVSRLALREEDREPLSGPKVAQAQIAAFRAWERVDGERFAKLRGITQPTSGGERSLRQHDSGQKFLCAGGAPAESDAADLSRRRPWVAVPVSRVVRETGVAVSRFRGVVGRLLDRLGLEPHLLPRPSGGPKSTPRRPPPFASALRHTPIDSGCLLRRQPWEVDPCGIVSSRAGYCCGRRDVAVGPTCRHHHLRQ